LKIERDELIPRLKTLKEEGYTYLVKITAVDYVSYIEVVYMVRDLLKNDDQSLEAELDPSDAWVHTATEVYKAADWYERELQEMFGVVIKGRDAERLLLEKWNGKGAPLRKNFTWNAPYESEVDD
jgi:NADH:ubiquinone oxidoreductase subunit C